ncbi:hypothetical protein ES689_09120 [Frigoribacterium sp. ACAM 257]|uniref:hypothetical protein n=1 Tax=Frigoribacterium sp. ACAM 257 TaxID=2508998 RepID=UPI0011B9E200|nr:hypothetical protein [Frigoribacterium sp. ACAM 257]TWX38760.1 hypothetical protein ES689_09120 [Frigoribacterium sp. ACAM 257]
MTDPAPARRELRRRGWHEWRIGSAQLVTPRRRVVLAAAAVVVGSAAALGTDRLFSGFDDLEWSSAVRAVAVLAFASMAVALVVPVAVGVWLRRERRALAPVSWRDDRLVVDYTSEGAPELSATLAPRLLASARKQRLGLVGTLTIGLGGAAAFTVGIVGVVLIAVVEGFPGFGFAGALLSLLSLPLTTAASLECLGRAAVAVDLAEGHPAAKEAPVAPAAPPRP